MLNSFQSPGEVAFYIFDMPVYFYGILMALAVFVGFCVTDYLYNKLQQINVATTSPLEREGKNNLILDISPLLIISGIIGARLYYCLINYSYYIQKPLEIFFIRQGGLSIHGAIIAGTLALFYFSKKYKVPFLSLTDVFLCGTILAQSIGRWGNFFNSEAFGYPCDLPWKLYIPISHRPLEYINFEYFHPTFLYESLLDFCIFLILIKVITLNGKLKVESGKLNNFQFFTFNFPLSTYKPGIITSLYLILYACARIFVEHFRIDSALNISGIPIAQITSAVMLLLGILLILYINFFNGKNSTPPTMP